MKGYRKAITLIETVIYLALIGSAFFLIVNFGFTIADFNRDAGVNNEIQQSLVFLNQHFEEHIELADSVDEAGSTLGVNPSTLALDDGAVTYIYSIDSGNLTFNDGTDTFNLTFGDASITNFLVEEVNFGEPEIYALRISVTMQFNKNQIITESFTNLYNVD